MLLTVLACTEPPILCIDGSVLGPGGCPGAADTGDPAPLLSAQEAMDHLADLLALGIPQARTPGEVYKVMMDHADDDCPGQDGGYFALDEPCTTADGYVFYGVSTWGYGLHNFDGQQEYVFGSLQTSMTATDPGGDTLTVGGIMMFGAVFTDQGTEANSRLEGTVHYPASPTWLATTTSASMEIFANPHNGGTRAELVGGYTIGSDSAHFDGLVWFEGCPAGSVRVRDRLGGWYTLELADCSGCGEVTSDGRSLGEACIDLAPAMTDLIDTLLAAP